MNSKYLQSKVSDINTELINEVITFAFKEGHKSHAPLGCSGETFILYGTSRRKEISLRLHSGDVKLLITDNIGGFLFYGGFDTSLLPISFISEQYMSIINQIKYLLENTKRSTAISEEDKEAMWKAEKFEGFIY